MSVRTHAHEIIRTWTFYSIVRSLYHTGGIPWKDLMICGFILAKKGEKISKSKSNNELDPRALIAAHSADVLRYWTAGARLGTDTFFAPDELAVPKRFITKLWNASKFAISHLQDINLSRTPELLPIDRWIIERVNETAASAAKLLHEYEISIHLTRWVKPSCIDDELIWFGEEIKNALSAMRKYKSERCLSMRDGMDTLEIRAEKRFEEWFRQTERDIQACSRATRTSYIFK